MSVLFIVGMVYGLIFGGVVAVILAFKSHPWRWAWLLSKVKRVPHGVAVLMSKKFGAVPIVVQKGKDVVPYKQGIWIWEDDFAIPINPTDGKKILEKAQKINPEYVYKINGVPTVFLSYEDLRPMKIEGITSDTIDPKRVGAILDGYVATRQAEVIRANKSLDLRTTLLLIGVAVILVAVLVEGYYLTQIYGQVLQLKQTIAVPHVVKEVNAMVVT